MDAERRKSSRFSINQIVEISTDQENFFSAEGVDLSAGGMLCKSNYEVEPYTQLFVMVTIPLSDGDHVLKTEATVIHSKMVEGKCVFGVEFNDLSPKSEKALSEYIEGIV